MFSQVVWTSIYSNLFPNDMVQDFDRANNNSAVSGQMIKRTCLLMMSSQAVWTSIYSNLFPNDMVPGFNGEYNNSAVSCQTIKRNMPSHDV